MRSSPHPRHIVLEEMEFVAVGDIVIVLGRLARSLVYLETLAKE